MSLSGAVVLVLSDDVGYLDKDGYLYVLGRDEQVIISDEHTVVIPEVEAELLAQGFAREVAVLPLQDEKTFSLHVFVVPLQGCASSTGLRSACRRALSIPISIHGVTVLPSIPRLPSGKVDRPQLLDKLGPA